MTAPNHPRPSRLLPFDDRTRRVLELREQVRNGTYRPDPAEVARALLAAWAPAPALDAAPAPSREFDRSRFIVPASARAPEPAQARAVS
ncbi:MAG: hypothetical protein KatS3mg062_0594 [Tepidiforma sp.]|nr:MAG: hypothetical protein KatS3mg062_0594 [Tepidiforma sp.]